MADFSEETYERLIAEICSRHQSVQSAGFGGDAYKPGLERTRAFDKALGSPSRSLRCIHVAGTNGKGSVCHMLASSLSASGLRVGLYTSPHLLDFRERARIVSEDGHRCIGKEEVFGFLTSNGPLIDRLGLSFFEITTILAFWWFSKEKVDIAVIETGLGGRLDSTNIITPELAVITSIGLDHCALLGNTRAEIAREKAGIFKAGRPALIGKRDDETGPVFEKAAKEAGCPLIFADDGIYDGIEHLLRELDLHGEYQAANLRTVLCALEILGVRADTDAIAKTARRTGLRGRWEIIGKKPLIIADIGHNPPALEWNFKQLEHIMECHDRLTVVYGVMADKALENIIPLMPDNSHTHYIFVTPATPRAMKAEEIEKRYAAHGPHLASYETAPSVQDGLRRALDMSSDDSVIYAGGSTFVVCEVLGSPVTAISD